MDNYTFFIDALRYPHPGWLENLVAFFDKLPAGEQVTGCRQFLDGIGGFNLAECEELYTRTFDLNPQAAPYIGYQVWGDSYRRGVFMSNLNRCYRELGIDCAGELPDHLLPVLRYFQVSPTPLVDLQEIYQPAVLRMIRDLKKSDAGNPYIHLLEAILAAVKVPAAAGDSLLETSQSARNFSLEAEFSDA